MKWKKIVDQPELKVYESKINGKTIRIEARLENDSWHIIKRSGNDVLEYKVNPDDFKEILNDILGKRQKRKIKKELKIKLYRTFKDNVSEKWIISIDDESYSNFAFVHMNSDIISVDVILHFKYKKYEEYILNELKITLGLHDEDVEYNVYYYTYSNKYFDLLDYYDTTETDEE